MQRLQERMVHHEEAERHQTRAVKQVRKAVLIALMGLASGCATMPHNIQMTQDTQNVPAFTDEEMERELNNIDMHSDQYEPLFDDWSDREENIQQESLEELSQEITEAIERLCAQKENPSKCKKELNEEVERVTQQIKELEDAVRKELERRFRKADEEWIKDQQRRFKEVDEEWIKDQQKRPRPEKQIPKKRQSPPPKKPKKCTTTELNAIIENNPHRFPGDPIKCGGKLYNFWIVQNHQSHHPKKG